MKKWDEKYSLQYIKENFNKKDFPTYYAQRVISKLFGSWNNALIKAEVKPVYATCQIENCNNPSRSQSCPWCEKHYYRNRRNGDPNHLQLCQYKLNHNLYSDEWNDANAWFVGLLWTDGWIGHKGNFIGLKSKDLQLIETAKTFLELDAEIKNRYTKKRLYYEVSFSSEKMANELRSIGLHANKSLTIEYPIGLPDKFFGSFFRGVIDGDGSVYKKKFRKGQQSLDISVQVVTGSLNFKDQLCAKLDQFGILFNVGARAKYLKNGKMRKGWKSTHHPLYAINISHKNSLHLLYKMMYPDEFVPCLKRKFSNFNEWILTPRTRSGAPTTIVDIPCPICGNLFHPMSRKTCSAECGRKLLSQSLFGSPCVPTPARIAYWESKKKPVESKICEWCSGEFIPKDRRGRFCSRTCAGLFSEKMQCRPIVIKVCPNCKKEFVSKNKTVKCCSLKCGCIYREKVKTTERNL